MSPHEHDQIGLLGRVSGDGNPPASGEILLPLTGVDVEAEVVDFIAEVQLSQFYRNPEVVPVEATYHFPVDDGASVCGFQVEYGDGTVVKGVVMEKSEAKQHYNEAISAGKQANMLASTRRDIFALRVGNLPPGCFVKVSITYVTYLKAQGDAEAFVLPTCIAPRFTPTDEILTPEETEAVAPAFTTFKLFGLDVKIKFNCLSAIKSITCPTHPRESSFSFQIKGKTGTVSCSDIAMDRDLVLLLKEEKAHSPRACIEVSEDGSMSGFVTIFPRVEFRDQRKEIIFVVDRSGSMHWSGGAHGKSQIEQASEALLLFLRALPPTCSFNIVGFGSTFSSLYKEPMPYNDKTLAEASVYASEMIRADMGGTEIKAPLEYIFGQKLASGTERQVFVLTDGQVSNNHEVFALIRQNCSESQKNTSSCRVFSLGIGAGVSRYMVNGMARAGRGTARFVEDGDTQSMCAKVLGQLKQALQPALDQVSIDWTFPDNHKTSHFERPNTTNSLLAFRSPGADASSHPVIQMCPSVIPPIFNEERFLSFAIFPQAATDIPDTVTIKSDSPDGPLVVTLDISDEDVFYGNIAHKMAATEAIKEYEDNQKARCGQFGVNSAMISGEEALRLALENSLVSEKTSFVAVLEKPVIGAGTKAVRTVIPQCLPGYGVAREDLLDLSQTTQFMQGQIDSVLSRGMCLDDLVEQSACLSQQSKMFLKQSRTTNKIWTPILFFGRMLSQSFTAILGFVRSAVSVLFSFWNPSPPAHPAVTPTSACTRAPPSGPPPLDKKKKARAEPDKLLRLCLMQGAAGAFPSEEDVTRAVGLNSGKMQHFSFAPSGPTSEELDPTVFGTLLAVAAMRTLFATRKDEWELHERKALGYVKSCGLSDSEAERVARSLAASLRASGCGN